MTLNESANSASLPSSIEPEGAPKKSFDVLPLTAETKRALEEMGYLHPTPVQIAAFDPAVRGRDVIVQARTGTGKTTAFGLPLVDQLVRKSGGLQALILCPTRELALQVAAEVTKLGKHRGVKIVAVYGGAPMGRQIADLEEGAHIVVGTPGRVLDHLRRGTMEPKQIRTLVLDEADEMLSMGFEKELNAIVERLPKPRQTLLFSATLGNDVGRIVREMSEPESILLSGDQVGALDLTHYFYLQQGDKIRDLLRVIEVEDPQSAIFFCNTKDDTASVARELKKAGFAADYISGDLEQKDRERVMAATREGKLRFLVATDVAARGIDISHLTHVINVDFPDNPSQYVHRTGRTGRAGRTGTAISLLSAKDIGNLYYLRLTYGLKPIERTLPSDQDLRTRKEADLITRIEKARSDKGLGGDARALARRLLAHDDAEGLVALLLTEFLGPQLAAVDQATRARRAQLPPPVIEAPVVPPRPPVERAAPMERATPERPTTEAPTRRQPLAQPAEVTPAPIAQPPMARAPVASPPIAQTPAPQAPIATTVRTTSMRDRPREDRPREDRPREDRPRDDRPREAAYREDRSREDRPPPRVPSSSFTPPTSDRGAAHRPPHRELADWTPPAEADDEAPLIARGAPASPEAPQSPQTSQSGSPESSATIFVNVGKRDGVRPSDLLGVLQERGQLGGDVIVRIRLRDRNAFIDLAPEVVQRAIDALTGSVLGGRTVNAERARPRQGQGGDADEAGRS